MPRGWRDKTSGRQIAWPSRWRKAVTEQVGMVAWAIETTADTVDSVIVGRRCLGGRRRLHHVLGHVALSPGRLAAFVDDALHDLGDGLHTASSSTTRPPLLPAPPRSGRPLRTKTRRRGPALVAAGRPSRQRLYKPSTTKKSQFGQAQASIDCSPCGFFFLLWPYSFIFTSAQDN